MVFRAAAFASYLVGYIVLLGALAASWRAVSARRARRGDALAAMVAGARASSSLLSAAVVFDTVARATDSRAAWGWDTRTSATVLVALAIYGLLAAFNVLQRNGASTTRIAGIALMIGVQVVFAWSSVELWNRSSKDLSDSTVKIVPSGTGEVVVFGAATLAAALFGVVVSRTSFTRMRRNEALRISEMDDAIVERHNGR